MYNRKKFFKIFTNLKEQSHGKNHIGIFSADAVSEYSLYNESIASFTTGELYDHHDAEGFINLFGLPLKVRAMMEKTEKKGSHE